jgi:zinc protease
LIKDKFKGFKARSFPLRNVPQEPEQIASRRLEMDYPTDLTRMVMAYQSVQLLDADLYALDVLSMALGQGESSRFYLELYKKYHLVESVSAGNYTPQDKGLFEISCLIKDQKVDHVIKAINNIIASIKSQGLMPDELDKVKRQVMAENIYDRQSAEGMADKAAADVAFTGSVDFSDRYLDGVRAVTNEDIKRVARRYLIEPRLNTVILKPISAKKDLPVNDKVSRQDVQKVVLPNGLILLLQEDHSLPIISISAVFNGGMRFETLPLNGLTSLMGSVWTKGLPGKTADQISRESESRAVSISSGGGRNSFTLSLNSLSEDREFILDYLEKFLKSPSFPETEIARDKEQMRTALIQRKDSVLQTSNRALVETLFEKHPLRWDSLGTEESLARIKRADILSAFDHCVRADNGVIAVFGDINIQDIRLELERRLASLPKGKPELPLTQESAPATMRLKELAMDKEQALVMFGFRGPMIKDADTYAAEVLVNVLSSSLGGRLFKRIRDEFGKSYTVSGSVSPAIDAGMMSFFALTTNEGIEKVRSIMQEEFTKVRETLISEQELADAKIYLKSKMARNMQSIGSQSITRAVDELLGLGYKNVDEYPAHIDAVSLEAVRAVAQKYLNTDHAAVVITRSSLKKTGE